jgi:hypothetical protein
MKKIKIGVFLVISLLIVSGVALAQGMEARYLVKSNNGLLKASLGVSHDFDNGFTTELTKGQLKALEMLGVGVEEVPLYHVLVKPICGFDGEWRQRWSRCKYSCFGYRRFY